MVEEAAAPQAASPPASPAEWESDWRALCEEADLLEKECWEEVSQPRSLPSSQLAELLAQRDETQRATAAWQSSLWSGLGRLRKRAAVVEQNLRRGFCREQLQTVTLDVERAIEDFRCRQREEFEGLAAEGPGMEEALRALGERFEGWAAEPSALERPLQRRGRSSAGASGPGGSERSASADVVCQPSAASSRGSPPSDDAELSEIREALKELEAAIEQAGGATGGWSMFRQSVFQRLFTMFKFQASEMFFARLAERLPDVPREESDAHVQWWEENDERQASKRQLLARWKARRAELDRQAAEAEEGRRAQSVVQQRQAEERKKGVRAEQRRQVAEWRRQRAEEGEREVAVHRSVLQERERQEREQLKARQQHHKEAIEAYRSQRELEAGRERSGERSGDASRRVLSQEDRQRIAQRNMELLKRKLQAQPPPLPPSGCVPPAPAKSREWADVESRLHCSTQSSMMKATGRSGNNSVSELSPTAAGQGGFGRARELPPRW